MALVVMYQALPQNVLLMVAEKDSAKLEGKTLKTMHVGVERVKEAKVKTLKTHFEEIHMKNGELVDDISMKLTSIVNSIHSFREKVEEISFVKKFLRVVPQTYMKIVSAIEQFGDLKNMTVKEIYGHYATECPKKRRNDEAKLTSFYDKDSSLMFAEGVKNSLPEDEETNLEDFMQELSKEELKVVFVNEEKFMVNLLENGNEYNHTDVWYLDNGANNHMMVHREKFNDLNTKINRNVKFKDRSKTHMFLDLACKKIRVSRDVAFEEENKWEWCNDNNELVQNSMEFGILRDAYKEAPLVEIYRDELLLFTID
ncbi:uncharacterized protein LOC124918464 [Impatiens glandulifera]|uniref:uncharacterized protein LOC124918464 n=1 Tax=Impatiens glandulifera TaxID=253017 RepID=UPI001FB0A954|nr:uncharacterized protein LOC124918464 [Impatiens glandulifera]